MRAQIDSQETAQFATVKYAMSEVMRVQFAETENYPFSAMVSDTGGAAGLFLGLNVIGILSFTKKAMKIATKGVIWTENNLKILS